VGTLNRWLLIATAVVAAGVLATASGIAISRVGETAGGGQPVVLSTSTPGALDAAGVHLTTAPVPPGCGLLPVRLPGCPITRSAAETAATRAAGGPRAHVREAVLAEVNIEPDARYGTATHGVDWVVSIDQLLPYMRAGNVAVAAMCVRPAAVPPGVATPCAWSGRLLVLVDAASGQVVMTMPRP